MSLTMHACISLCFCLWVWWAAIAMRECDLELWSKWISSSNLLFKGVRHYCLSLHEEKRTLPRSPASFSGSVGGTRQDRKLSWQLLSEDFMMIIRKKMNAGISSLHTSFYLVEMEMVLREILNKWCECWHCNFCSTLQQPHELHLHSIH